MPASKGVAATMLPSALSRFALPDEGADVSLSPGFVSAALRGNLLSPLVYLQMQQQQQQQQRAALRNSMLANEVTPHTQPHDVLAALISRDALREALLSRHRDYARPFEPVASVDPRFLYAQQEAIIKEAFQRGRDAAVMSLLRSGTIDSPIPQRAEEKRAKVEKIIESVESKHTTSNSRAVATTKKAGSRNDRKSSYFDASTLEDPDEQALATRRTRGGVTEPFPEKMHRLLQDCEENGEADVISFFPHGRAFTIHHVERFCREVMPRYFKQSRLSSFQRQLNLYGFRRITSGPDVGGYYNELFLKGRPALSIRMRRVGIAKAGGSSRSTPRASQSFTTTPDFYSMAPIQGKAAVSESDRNEE